MKRLSLLLTMMVALFIGAGCALFPEKPDSPKEPSSPYKLHSVSWVDGKPNYIKLSYEGIESWPKVKDPKKGKNMQSIIYINGKKVEHMWEGMTVQHINNAKQRGGEYYQDLKKGEVVKVSLVSMDKKYKTNEKDLVWK